MMNVEIYDSSGRLDHNATVASLEELVELAQMRRVRIVGPGKLDHAEAMLVIDAYRETHGLPGTLETMEQMKAQRHMLTHRERHCFDHIFEGFRQLFHGDAA